MWRLFQGVIIVGVSGFFVSLGNERHEHLGMALWLFGVAAAYIATWADRPAAVRSLTPSGKQGPSGAGPRVSAVADLIPCTPQGGLQPLSVLFPTGVLGP
jgi:hypothetical protein